MDGGILSGELEYNKGLVTYGLENLYCQMEEKVSNIKHIIANKIRCRQANAPENCQIGKNTRIRKSTLEGKNVIAENVKIFNSRVGYGTFVAEGAKVTNCEIGRYCAVGFQSALGAHPLHEVVSIHPAFYSTKGQYGFTYVKKATYEEFQYLDEEKQISIVIGNDVWVTSGKATTIVQGITIGDGAVVLGNAMVTKDVPPYAIVGGIPAKVVGYRFSEDEIKFLLHLKWWNRTEQWLIEHAECFKDIKILMQRVLEEEKDFWK